ncbi:PDZ domain-containing protein [Peribacillus glennii]|uniref:PDZ domain-containing protein n=1 Tax=Peribacillus glennii TaxID=2303991 RepID=A0A372LDU9_9BACI|nr:PDZ domain-containing protein [Peribacillus glennii]RFU63923.1 PDZ domain-containing protein [Peribacillus glennii]
MTEEWLFACLKGLGTFFLHPVFYVSVFLSVLIGYLRVKRERSDFHIRIHDMFQEMRFLLPRGITYGLILSLITLAAGLVIPFASLLLIGILSLMLSVTLRFRFLSPAYSIGLAFFLIFFMYGRDVQLPLFEETFHNLDRPVYSALPILLGLLLIAEGALIRRSGHKKLSPKLLISKRGFTVGSYVSKRMWLVPMFVLVPGGNLPALFEWWPVFSVGNVHVSPMFVPFLIGFSHQIKGMLPGQAIRAYGKQVLIFGIVITAIAAAGHWYPVISMAAVVLAVLGRELITYFTNAADEKRPFYFSRSKLGVRILGILPHSPADKMGLQMGEVISKVNGVTVRDEREFYEALLKNRAHCKLEVVGNNDQIRFVQRALFEGEHHELGILFVEGMKKERGRAV